MKTVIVNFFDKIDNVSFLNEVKNIIKKNRYRILFFAAFSLLFLLLDCSNKVYENPDPPAGLTFKINGTVFGLTNGDVLVLQNNGFDLATVNQTGSGPGYFTFPTALENHSSYNVTAALQPVAKNCDLISGGFGTINNSDVYEIFVNCVAGPFFIGGTMKALPTGSSVTLQYDYIDPLTGLNLINSTIWGNGGLSVPFSTPKILLPNTKYTISVLSTSANVTCTPICDNTGILKYSNMDFAFVSCGLCGNGIVEPPETCDDRNVLSGDGCSSRCQKELCGNGIVDKGETCDDSNLKNGDGCNATCQSEGRYANPTSFDDATLQGWSADGMWYISSQRKSTGNYSMRYGNVFSNTYDTPGLPNSGSLISPTTPVLSSSAKISFDYFKYGFCNQNTLSVQSLLQTTCTAVDTLTVEISTNGGLIWKILEYLPEAHSTLVPHTTLLGAFAGLTPKIRFFFNTVDQLNNNYEGAYIDNILITP